MFLKMFTGNIELEQRIESAQVQMWFAVIRAEWASLLEFVHLPVDHFGRLS